MKTPLLVDREAAIQSARRIGEFLAGIDRTAQDGIEQAIQQFQEDKFRITVLGKAKRGKSTLINAWLGRSDDLVAPIDKLPASSVISEVSWGEAEQCTARFRTGQQREIAFTQIREFATEELNPENGKGVSTLDVRGPFPGLERDLELVDTPGAGSLHEHHDQVLHAFIPQSDAVIFMVTAAMPLDQDELELLKKVQAADIKKIFFVINKVDATPDNDVQDAIAHNTRCLQGIGVGIDTFYWLSAKKAFEGDINASGLDALKTAIAGFVAVERAQVLQARFVSRVNEAARPVIQRLALELAGARKTDEGLDADLKKLAQAKDAIEKERPLAEREFRHRWKLALDGFERSLRDAAGEVKSRLHSEIDGTPVAGVSALQKELPTILARIVNACLEPPARKLEQDLLKATEALQASCPSIDILPETGAIQIRSGNNNTFLIGGLAGVGMSAAGVAGALAAASAATAVVGVPTVLGSLLAAGVGSLGLSSGMAGIITGIISSLGTASVAVPTWLALAGPVGWTIAGIGALVVPLAWRTSKAKLKDELHLACDERITEIFKSLAVERVGELRGMADSIAESFGIRLAHQLNEIESDITRSKQKRLSPDEVAKMETLASQLKEAFAQFAAA